MPIRDEELVPKLFRIRLDSFPPLAVLLSASDAKLENLGNSIEGKLARLKSRKANNPNLATPNTCMANSRNDRGQKIRSGHISKKNRRVLW